MKPLVIAIALFAAAFAAQAQTVYRCGPEGRSYSDSPCNDGRAVDVGDARSSEQAQAATAAARRDRQLADALRRERLAREAEGARLGVIALGPTAAPEPAVKGIKKAVPARPRSRKPVSPPKKPARPSAATPA